VTNAVVLLVRSGEFVLFDQVLEIILATSHRDQPNLAMFAHHLPVKIIAWAFVLFEGAIFN
jgi:hypothetical protein